MQIIHLIRPQFWLLRNYEFAEKLLHGDEVCSFKQHLRHMCLLLDRWASRLEIHEMLQEMKTH